MHKIEHQQRMGRLDHKRALMERHATNAPAPRARVQTVRRATLALAGAGLALTALAIHVI
jgi:hypothetical protein